MKVSKLIALMALAYFSVAPVLAQDLDRDIHYAGALKSFDRGDFTGAALAFEKAIQCDPLPQSGGDEYIPYIHLAAAQFELGQFAQARAALIQSQIYAVAPESHTGEALLENYAKPIMAVALDPGELRDAAYYIAGGNGNYSLMPEEVQRIRSETLRRCAVSSRVNESKLPWYFHYEFGIDLMEAGDAEKGLESLKVGASKRMESGRGSRMYGMWFIDYLPYYQMALAHSRLGNWESAQDAIRTSENFGEFSPVDPGYEAFTILEKQITSKLKNNNGS